MGLLGVGVALAVVLAVIGASYFYFTLKTGVPTFPTMPGPRRKMIEVIQADMQERGVTSLGAALPYTIVDLGSGSGQLSWHIAKALPHARVIGIELSPIPWLRSVIHQKLFGPANLSYVRTDFWSYDLGGADVVVTYLMEQLMERVKAKLQEELKPSALVISNKFTYQGWEPAAKFHFPLPFNINLFVYRADEVLGRAARNAA